MAKKRRDEPSKDELRRRIQADTKAFLVAGGHIQNIIQGKSGVESRSGVRHITLGSNKKQRTD